MRTWLPVAGLLMAAVASLAAEPAGPLPEIGSAGGLALAPNGQTCLVIDEARRAVVAFEPDRPGRWRDVVAAANDGLPEPLAVGWLPGDIVAAVCRVGNEWSLRSFRIRPDVAADPAAPLQTIEIGFAGDSAKAVTLVVGRGGEWIAVAGLPDPLPPLLRAPVAGVRVGRLSDRDCPRPAAAEQFVAAAVSPADELLLVVRSGSGDLIAFFDGTGRELLRVPAGVREIRDVDFARDDGTLWATGIDDAGAGGLWRLDAEIQGGRQAVRAVPQGPLETPGDLVAATGRKAVVVMGAPPRRLRVIDPEADAREEGSR